MPVGCGLCPRVWLWQLDVVGEHLYRDDSCMCLVLTCVTWQLEEIGNHEFGCASWMWFVPACVVVAVWCVWGPTRVAVTVECVWCLRVWPW